MRFYLGTHKAQWLDRVDIPLFVSHRTLAVRKAFPRARAPWALDSGGFTELSLHGEWTLTPAAYAAAVRRYATEIGRLEWAAPQDWMNEPAMLRRTGFTVPEHQRRTVENLLELRTIAPDLPFVPVLQGWTPDDYDRCADLYAAAGIDLTLEPLVGVGTVCRRQDTRGAEVIVNRLAARGLRLHGFGIKTTGLRRYGSRLASSDSLAWSYGARVEAWKGRPRTCPTVSCSNCLHYAQDWRRRLLDQLEHPGHTEQLTLAI